MTTAHNRAKALSTATLPKAHAARRVNAAERREGRAYDAGATKRTAPLPPWLRGDPEALKALPKRPPGKS